MTPLRAQALKFFADQPELAREIASVVLEANSARHRRANGGLTQRQADALEFVRLYPILHGGVSPSYDEILDGIGLSSKGEVHRIVVALEERGFIRRLPNRARSIMILDNRASSSRTVEAAGHTSSHATAATSDGSM